MRLITMGALFILGTLPALAQQAPDGTPTRIRGTVEKLDGQTLLVKSTAGQDVPVTMAADARITGVVTVSYTHLTLPTNREV